MTVFHTRKAKPRSSQVSLSNPQLSPRYTRRFTVNSPPAIHHQHRKLQVLHMFANNLKSQCARRGCFSPPGTFFCLIREKGTQQVMDNG